MDGLIAFWAHALAAALFLSLIAWRLQAGVRLPAQRLMLAGFALTACWAWLTAIEPASALPDYAETMRNLVWLGLLHSLSGGKEAVERQPGLRLVYGAVGLVLGLQLFADALPAMFGSQAAAPAIAATATVLRITAAAGLLVLVHNLYGQAAPASRDAIAMPMLALVLTWGYDLNLYTLAYLDPDSAGGLTVWRGVAIALTAPMFAINAGREEGWRINLSRAATFQSLSLLGICGYFAVMTVLATALRETGWDWSQAILIAMLAAMTVAAMVLLPSQRARGWAKVKLAKHLFEHRFDYRSEWLRFAATVGRSGPEAPPLGERLIRAFADIVDSPGGLLLVADDKGEVAEAAAWNWPGEHFPADRQHRNLWAEIEARPLILDLDAMRRDGASIPPLPSWVDDNPDAWAGVPLIHNDRMVGLVLLAAPDYRRALDWEDFDLLKTAGRQAASSLAEARGQQALAEAQRFDEFNRRFAFILHDIKNLVSQLSLVARNAERHADNPDFRADMIATLQSSVGKMNDLLARLAPQAHDRPLRTEPQPLQPILAEAIAARRQRHDVRLSGDQSLWVVADATALGQAVAHLLDNAIDASPADQPVTVDVSSESDAVAITITDRGAGMDADFIHNQLFQPFASTKASGFGVGAFEARALVAAMGGRMAVDSRPGEGSRFTIHLPAAEPAAQPIRKRA